MVRRTNEEDTVICPIKGCNEEVLSRGLFMHIFHTNDSDGEGHYPKGEIPPEIDKEEIKVTGQKEVEMDYPDEQDLEDALYLDTYTGKAYKGKRGLMIHLGQLAGRDNIPEDVTERHRVENFPVVEVDNDGNITEVLSFPSGDVPSIEPYLPWYDDPDKGYIAKKEVKELVEEVRESSTGTISANKVEEKLLDV
jgi:hypothetical protein